MFGDIMFGFVCYNVLAGLLLRDVFPDPDVLCIWHHDKLLKYKLRKDKLLKRQTPERQTPEIQTPERQTPEKTNS